MDDTFSPAARGIHAWWWFISLLLLAALTVGIVLFRFEPTGVVTMPGVITFCYRPRADDTPLQRALALPPGTPKATVDATLGASIGWWDKGAQGGEGAYYPESAYIRSISLASTDGLPAFSSSRGMGSEAKAIIVHFDSSLRLRYVEPTVRTWPY